MRKWGLHLFVRLIYQTHNHGIGVLKCVITQYRPCTWRLYWIQYSQIASNHYDLQPGMRLIPHEPLKQSEELLSQPSVIMFFSCSCDISLHLHKPKALSVSVRKKHSARLWWASGGVHWGAVKDSSWVGRQFLDPIPSEETPGEKLSNLYRDFCRMQLIMPIPHRHTHWPMDRFQTRSEAHGDSGTQATDRPEDQDDGLEHVFWKVPQECQTWSKNKNKKKII